MQWGLPRLSWLALLSTQSEKGLTMPTLLRTLSAPQGRALSNRYQARAFKHACDMNAFLAKGDNALHWRETKAALKSGVYFSQGHGAEQRYIPESALRA
jgi:hypothetical protein